MKIKFLLAFALIFLLIFQNSTSQKFTVGVSTPTIDVGTLDPGTSKVLSFYIITPSEKDILVDLSTENPDVSVFDSSKYSSLFSELSEEPSSNWVEFFSNPVLLRPNSDKLETKGGIVSGWREIRFLLKVPEDAEPGYHLVKIRPEPRIPKSPDQGVIKIRTVTPVNLIFKVSDLAERKLKILDVVSGGMAGTKLELNIHVLNEGTVTATCRADRIKIYNSTGDSISKITSGFYTIEPNKIEKLKVYWDTRNHEPGEYSISVDLDYFTGRDFKETTFEYTLMPTADVVIPIKEEKKTSNILIFIILAIIIFIAYLIYRWVN